MSKHIDLYDEQDPLDFPDDYDQDIFDSFPIYRNDDWLNEWYEELQDNAPDRLTEWGRQTEIKI